MKKSILIIALVALLAIFAISCVEDPIYTPNFDPEKHMDLKTGVLEPGYTVVIDDTAYKPNDITSAKVKGKTIELAADLEVNNLELEDTKVVLYTGDRDPGRKNLVLNATVKSGNVTLKGLSTKGIKVDTNFAGSLTFEGGILESTDSANNKEAFLIPTDNAEADYTFKGMTVATSTQKGIKIQSAKSITIENCTFDAKYLKEDAVSGSKDWETRSLSAIDITLEKKDDNTKTNITIKGNKFSDIPKGSFKGGVTDSDTAGAIKIKAQNNTSPVIETVEITGNIFTNCCRDIVIGKADETGNVRHKNTYIDGSNPWTVKDNKPNKIDNIGDKGFGVLTDNSKTPVEAKKIGKAVGGAVVFDIADAYTDKDTYSVKYTE